jgi:hypothetical protein
MEMIEMGVGEQDQVNGRQVLDFHAGAPEALQKKKPVGKIGINEHVEIGKLGQEGGVANPGEGDLPAGELGKARAEVLAGAAGEPCFPDQFIKKSAGIEMSAGGEIAKGAREQFFSAEGFWPAARFVFWHNRGELKDLVLKIKVKN